MTVNQSMDEFRSYTALSQFAYGSNDRPSGLLSVTCKTGFAAARSRMTVHVVKRMAAVRSRSRLRYGAQWLCGGGSADAVAISDPDAHGGRCDRCMDTLARGFVPGAAGYVYRCFDAANQLLYVGSTTGRVSARLAAHQKSASWWPAVADVQVESFGHELAARGAEFTAIRTEHPVHNVYGKRRDGAA